MGNISWLLQECSEIPARSSKSARATIGDIVRTVGKNFLGCCRSARKHPREVVKRRQSDYGHYSLTRGLLQDRSETPAPSGTHARATIVTTVRSVEGSFLSCCRSARKHPREVVKRRPGDYRHYSLTRCVLQDRSETPAPSGTNARATIVTTVLSVEGSFLSCCRSARKHPREVVNTPERRPAL